MENWHFWRGFSHSCVNFHSIVDLELEFGIIYIVLSTNCFSFGWANELVFLCIVYKFIHFLVSYSVWITAVCYFYLPSFQFCLKSTFNPLEVKWFVTLTECNWTKLLGSLIISPMGKEQPNFEKIVFNDFLIRFYCKFLLIWREKNPININIC